MKKKLRSYTITAMFPALMAATAGITIPLGILPPITLQTFFVILAGLMLGPKNAFISMIIYLLLGAIGIPVFSGFRSGIAVLFGSTGGFLLGFVIIALYIGIIKKLNFIKNQYFELLFISISSTILLYGFGGIYMAALTKTNFLATMLNFIIYIPGDIIKALLACILYLRLSKILKI